MPLPLVSRPRTPLLTVMALLALGLGSFMLWRSPADALETPPGPPVEVMRFKSGVTVLVSSQPALPVFTATLHYKAGQAQEWQGLFGAAELAGDLMLDGTDRIGTRDPKLEASLLDALDKLDQPLRRKKQALSLMDPERAAALRPEINALTARQQALLKDLAANSLGHIYARLYRERGARGPTVTVTPSEIQYTVTLPSDQLSYFLALEGARLSSFSSRSFYAARNALAERRALDQATPGAALLRGLLATAFQVHPFGRYQADAASIAGIDRGELELFARIYLRPAQTVIALAGGVRGSDVRAIADHYLSELAPGPNPGPIEPIEPRQAGERRVEVRAAGRSEVLLAFHRQAAGLRVGDPLAPVLEDLIGDPQDGLLAGLRGKGLAGDLVAAEYPLAPPIGSLYPGVVILGATVGRKGTPEKLETAMRRLLADLAEQGPTPEALEGARHRVQAHLAEIMSDPSRLAPVLARSYATLEDEQALAHLYQKVGQVRIDQVKAVAASLFAASNRTVAVMRGDAGEAVAAREGSSDARGEKASSASGAAAAPEAGTGSKTGEEHR